jgi:hypothetical protein
MYETMAVLAPLVFGLICGFSLHMTILCTCQHRWVEVAAWFILVLLALVYALYVAWPMTQGLQIAVVQ